METCAVIAGISEFAESRAFSALHGARLDAAWLERLLKANGVHPKNIRTLFGQQATRSAILSSVQHWQVDGPVRLLVFISTHGASLSYVPNQIEDLFYCYDTQLRDRLGTSITLPALFGAISQAPQVSELYVFIDACNVAIRSVSKQLQLLAATLSDKTALAVFVANDSRPTLEGFTSGLGEFSSLLIRSIKEHASVERPSIGGLALAIEREATLRGLIVPAVITMGSVSSWVFGNPSDPSHDAHKRTAIDSATVELVRSEFVASAVTALMNTNRSTVCVTGAGGSGKSVAIRQLARELHDPLYLSFARSDRAVAYSDIEFRVKQELLRNSDGSIGLGDALRPIEALLQVWSERRPDPIIILDGLDNLDEGIAGALAQLAENLGIRIIMTARELPTAGRALHEISMPPLTRGEAQWLSRRDGIEDEDHVLRAFAASGGWPAQFLSALHSVPDLAVLPGRFIECAAAIKASCGFFDADLFCAVFGLASRDLVDLARLGGIERLGPLSRLHDRCDEFVAAPARHVFDRACQYWQSELSRNREPVVGARVLEWIVNHATKARDVDDDLIVRAVTLSQAIAPSNLLEAIAELAIAKALTSSIAMIMEILSTRGEVEPLKRIVSRGSWPQELPLESEMEIRVLLALARADWWLGEYEGCKVKAARCIEISRDRRIIERAQVEIAIADFFIGNWDDVESRLQVIVSGSPKDLRVLGWAKLMLGTVLGFQAEKVSHARALLQQSANLLIATNDIAGVSIAYGNCGEVSWKAGLYDEAEVELTRALSYSEAAAMPINQIDIKQNLLRLYSRWKGAASGQVSALIAELRPMKDESIGKMQAVQLAHVMVGTLMRRREFGEATEWHGFGMRFAGSSKQYDAYTLLDKAMLEAVSPEAGADYLSPLKDAMVIAISSRNRSFADQAKDDIIDCIGPISPGRAKYCLRIVESALEEMTDGKRKY